MSRLSRPVHCSTTPQTPPELMKCNRIPRLGVSSTAALRARPLQLWTMVPSIHAHILEAMEAVRPRKHVLRLLSSKEPVIEVNRNSASIVERAVLPGGLPYNLEI